MCPSQPSTLADCTCHVTRPAGQTRHVDNGCVTKRLDEYPTTTAGTSPRYAMLHDESAAGHVVTKVGTCANRHFKQGVYLIPLKLHTDEDDFLWEN